MKVKPANEQGYRHPNAPYRYLAAAGEEVPETNYWWRALIHGAVVLVSPEPAAEPATEETFDAIPEVAEEL